VIGKLAARYAKLHVCYEAGPTGYGLYRQVKALGHDCAVVAPSLIPKKPGDRVKTNRRDAVTLARLHRAGELTSIWVPDAIHEAVRDLARGPEAAAEDLRKKRQQLMAFLLRHGRIFDGLKHWTVTHIAVLRPHTGSSARTSLTRPLERFQGLLRDSYRGNCRVRVGGSRGGLRRRASRGIPRAPDRPRGLASMRSAASAANGKPAQPPPSSTAKGEER